MEKSLDGAFSNLHLFIVGGRAEIRGSFPVHSRHGRVLDPYSLRITVPEGLPRGAS